MSPVGFKHSEESKRKISEACKGIKFTEEHKKKLSEAKLRNHIRYWKGKKRRMWSDEHKRKMSEANKGKTYGRVYKPLSEEHKKKISLANKGREHHEIKGEKHPCFNNWSSFEPYSKEFNNKLKERIRKKYGYRCVECNFTEKQLGYKLASHHIDYNKQNNSEENLIPLCKSCHAQTNFKREDWIEYFKNKGGL